MKAGSLLAAGLLVGALFACSTLEIRTDHDPEADFSGLQTWGWLRGKGGLIDDPRISSALLEERIRRGIEQELAARGFEQRGSGTPDFLVGYHAAVEDKLDVQSINDYYAYGGGWGNRYWYGRSVAAPPRPSTHTLVTEYQMGTIIVDVADPETRELMWRGYAEAEVDPKADPAQREKNVREAIRRILERFPPSK